MYVAYFFDAEIAAVSAFPIVKATAFRDIRHLIGCNQVDTVFLEDSHIIHCDESSLGAGLERFTQIEGVEIPLAGNLVITGIDRAGGMTTPSFSIEQMAARIEIIRPLLDPLPARQICAAHAKRFQIRLIREKARILRSQPARLKLVR